MFICMFILNRSKYDRTVVCEARFAEAHEEVLLYFTRCHKLGANRTVEAWRKEKKNKTQTQEHEDPDVSMSVS